MARRGLPVSGAVFVGLGALALAVPDARGQATAAPACPIGYTLGFFNGVWNTEFEAQQGMYALRDALRETIGTTKDVYDNEDIAYHFFYNHTGSTVGSNGLQDIAEVFIQRANELDPTGVIANQYLYLMWEPLIGTGPGYSSKSPALTAFISHFVNDSVGVAITTLAKIVSTPPTAADYAQQDLELSNEIGAGRKILMVAHSQGNLFVNHAYDDLLPLASTAREKVVHIAPASPTLRGPWVLTDIDLVINGLRAANGPNSVPDNNLTLVPSLEDKSGHTLIGTYLDGTRPGRGAVEQLMVNGLSALDAPQCTVMISPQNPTASAGAQVPLMIQPTLPRDDKAMVTYTWKITGNAGGAFMNPQTGLQPMLTQAPPVTYVAAQTVDPMAQDTVSVTINLSEVDQPSQSKVLATASTTISFSSAAVSIDPPSATIGAGQMKVFKAVPPGMGASGIVYSYRWSNTDMAGKLSGAGSDAAVDGGGAAYCSTSASTTYTSTSVGMDTIGAEIFAMPDCAAGSSLGKGSAGIEVLGLVATLVPTANIGTTVPNPLIRTFPADYTAGGLSVPWGYVIPADPVYSPTTFEVVSTEQTVWGQIDNQGSEVSVHWTGTSPGTYDCSASWYDQGWLLELQSYGSQPGPVGPIVMPNPGSCSVNVTSFGTNVGDSIAGTYSARLWRDQQCAGVSTTCPDVTSPYAADLSGAFLFPPPPSADGGAD